MSTTNKIIPDDDAIIIIQKKAKRGPLAPPPFPAFAKLVHTTTSRKGVQLGRRRKGEEGAEGGGIDIEDAEDAEVCLCTPRIIMHNKRGQVDEEEQGR